MIFEACALLEVNFSYLTGMASSFAIQGISLDW